MSRVIAVWNYKGGSSKTTTALNLGAALSLRDYRVRLVDVDFSEALYDYRAALPDVEFITGQIEHVADLLKDAPHFTLIDCPPALNRKSAESVIGAVDAVIVPAMPRRAAAEEAIDAVRLADSLGKPARALLTQYVAQKAYCREVRDDLRAGLNGEQMAGVIVPYSHAFCEAEIALQTIFQYAPQSLGARAYERLATEVIEWR